MKYSVQKDQKKRNLHLVTEKERVLLKSIVQNLNLQPQLRLKAQLKLSELPKRSSFVQTQRRCVVSGRKRFLIRGFHLSRFVIRKYANDGYLPGIRKSSW
jgi:small subunit ribosomal protein S14